MSVHPAALGAFIDPLAPDDVLRLPASHPLIHALATCHSLAKVRGHIGFGWSARVRMKMG